MKKIIAMVVLGIFYFNFAAGRTPPSSSGEKPGFLTTLYNEHLDQETIRELQEFERALRSFRSENSRSVEDLLRHTSKIAGGLKMLLNQCRKENKELRRNSQ